VSHCPSYFTICRRSRCPILGGR